MSILKGTDFAKIEMNADGELVCRLQRMGRVRIEFEGSPLRMEVAVERDAKRNFRCTVKTGAEGKGAEAVKVANEGKEPGVTYVFWNDAQLRAEAGKKKGKAAGKVEEPAAEAAQPEDEGDGEENEE